MRYLTALSDLLFGTAQRWAVTLGVVGLAIVVVKPGLLLAAVSQLMAELAPLLGPALAIFIVFAGIKMILFGKK